jgi:hypothetical protein
MDSRLISLKNHRILAVVFALLILASFFAALFHQHHAEDHHSLINCAICRLVHQFGLLVIFAFLFMIRLPLQTYFATTVSQQFSLFLASQFQNRAPPFFA